MAVAIFQGNFHSVPTTRNNIHRISLGVFNMIERKRLITIWQNQLHFITNMKFIFHFYFSHAGLFIKIYNFPDKKLFSTARPGIDIVLIIMAIMALKKDGMLASDYTIDQATDVLWTMLSLRNWEQLTQQCGWTQAHYIKMMKSNADRIFVRT